MPLTEVACKNAKPEEKSYKLTDGGGMYLEVMPNGSKYWRMQYRFEGKQKRLALGVYPEIGLKDARAKRDSARQLLANEVDPSENRKAVKAARRFATENSFEVVAREWITKMAPSWVPTNTTKILARLEKHVFPWLGNKPISDIEAPDLLAVLRRIEAAGILETATRTRSNCSQVFRYAIATGRAKQDPAHALIGALAKPQTKHFAAITEPTKIAALLRDIDDYKGSFPTRCALQLSALLFQRPGELRSMAWDDVDLDTAEWRYFVTKTKTQHIVPLSTQAVAILRELEPLTGAGRFVFPGEVSRDRPMSENTVRQALRRMGYANEEMTPHGFRAMARTVLDEELEVRIDFIEHQLAHAVKDPNGRAYNRTAHLAKRREMMQRWADYLDTLKQGATIIPLGRAA